MLRQHFLLWSMVAVLGGISILLSQATSAAEEHRYNRSLVAQASFTNIQWNSYDSAGKAYCGTACSYLQRVGGTKSTPGSWTLLPATWPNSSTNSSPFPIAFSLIEYMPTNETTWNDDLVIYDTDYKVRSQVYNGRGERYMRASVQKNGNPSVVVAYQVRVQNQSSGTRDYFVRFTAPKNKNHFRAAYEVGGPSQQQPVPVGDNDGLALSSAEILVDGLPVWHSANSIHRKDKVANAYGLLHSWGEDTSDDFYILYLGRYASTANFDFNYILNASVDADAPDCGQDFYSYIPETTYIRQCQLIGAGRDMPTASVGGAPFEIFSTSTLPVYLYFNLDTELTLSSSTGG